MPRIETSSFGAVEYTDDAVFEFPAGVPGFEDQCRFLPIERPAYLPLLFLQSLDPAGPCFITLPVLVVDPAYRLAVEPEERTLLGLAGDREPVIGADVLCLAILTVTGQGPATANLLSPVVVNMKTRVAVQIVQSESGYSHRHPVAGGAQEASPCS
jgi:flagellar assembly factor FliW